MVRVFSTVVSQLVKDLRERMGITAASEQEV